RMVDRVHRRAADGRLDAAPTLRTGFTQLLEVVLDVADFADRGAAIGRHLAHFAGAKTQRRVTAVAGDQLRTGASGASQLRTLARLHLDAMHRGADRHVAQRQAVAGLDRRILAGDDLIAFDH